MIQHIALIHGIISTTLRSGRKCGVLLSSGRPIALVSNGLQADVKSWTQSSWCRDQWRKYSLF